MNIEKSIDKLTIKTNKVASMKVLEEFKAFALKGNVVDLAVGVIIGAAFGKIVTSLVNDVIMPPIGLLLGGVDFSEKMIVLKDAVEATETTEAVEAVTLNYGLFINNVIDFLIVSIAIFFMIKWINKIMKKEAEKTEKSPAKDSPEVLVLKEIRDSLKKQTSTKK